MTEDGNKIIFIGKKYHYIFLNHESLSDIVKWNDNVEFKANFSDNFFVTLDNKITGKYEVTCECNDIDNTKKQWLKDHGFVRLLKEEKTIYKKVDNVTGDRYLSNNLVFDKYEKIDEKYSITVETEKTSLGVAGRVALTPIAVAEDGVATIGAVGILIIAAPFAAGHYILDTN